MEILFSALDSRWASVGGRVVALVLTWLAVWYLTRHLGSWFDRFYTSLRGYEISRRELRSLDALLDGLLILGGAVITLAILNLTPLLTSLLAAAGVTGVIIGFAVKDVAANLISGVILLVDHPFSLGDFVSAGNIQGTVEQISLRSTRLRTPDGPLVTVPNSIIAANAITNYSETPLRRFEVVLTLPRKSGSPEQCAQNLERAIRLLLDLASAEPRLARDPAPQVLVGDIREPSFDLKLICHAPNEIWATVQSDMKRALLVRTAEAGLFGQAGG